jgi:hypothetical protein
MGSHDAPDPDVDALDRRSTQNVIATTELIAELDRLLDAGRRRLDEMDRSLDHARSVAAEIDIDLRVVDLTDGSERAESSRPDATTS